MDLTNTDTDAIEQACLGLTGRRGARAFLVQALYQWQVAETELSELLRQFAAHKEYAKVDSKYFTDCLPKLMMQAEALSELLTPHADRSVQALDAIERAILWLGAFEMQPEVDVPPKVAVNEAVELAKLFAGEDSYKYINAMLEKLLRQV